jgi:DNA-binding NarL/FixJ family response regulator
MIKEPRIMTNIERTITRMGFCGSRVDEAVPRIHARRYSPVLRLITTGNGRTVQLTAREQEVLRLLSLGLSHKEIAHQMGICHDTTRSYVSQMLRFLGLSNARALLVWALQHPDAARAGVTTIGAHAPSCRCPLCARAA